MFKIQNSVLFLFVSLYFIFSNYAISKTNNVKSNDIVGANQKSKYENLLKNKRIGIVANLSLIQISETTIPSLMSYAVF